MPGSRYVVILIYSTSHAIRAEKILHRAGIASKLIPVPRHLSSDCGVCLRIDPSDAEAAEEALEEAGMEIEGMHAI
ncbi:MAG: DUF3343 domain-containing protein [Chloroflexota bacterium]|nr:DUF3343 domain-containing protein [Chloroflexota bacterium]